MLEVLSYVHLDHRVRLAVSERLCSVQKLPQDALVRVSALLVAAQRLVVRAALRDALGADPVRLGMGLYVERPVERQEAHGRSCALYAVSELPAVHAKVVVSASC